MTISPLAPRLFSAIRFGTTPTQNEALKQDLMRVIRSATWVSAYPPTPANWHEFNTLLGKPILFFDQGQDMIVLNARYGAMAGGNPAGIRPYAMMSGDRAICSDGRVIQFLHAMGSFPAEENEILPPGTFTLADRQTILAARPVA